MTSIQECLYCSETIISGGGVEGPRCRTCALAYAAGSIAGEQAERKRIASALVKSPPQRNALTSRQIDHVGVVTRLTEELNAAWDLSAAQQGRLQERDAPPRGRAT